MSGSTALASPISLRASAAPFRTTLSLCFRAFIKPSISLLSFKFTMFGLPNIPIFTPPKIIFYSDQFRLTAGYPNSALVYSGRLWLMPRLQYIYHTTVIARPVSICWQASVFGKLIGLPKYKQITAGRRTIYPGSYWEMVRASIESARGATIIPGGMEISQAFI